MSTFFMGLVFGGGLGSIVTFMYSIRKLRVLAGIVKVGAETMAERRARIFGHREGF